VDDGFTVKGVVAGDAATVVVTGEIDLVARGELEEAIRRVRRDDRRLVVDLSGVTFFGSTGLTWLVLANQAEMDAGGALLLRRPSEIVRSVLALSGMARSFVLEDAGPADEDHPR
jgi:anti-sigma B factor antagonist